MLKRELKVNFKSFIIWLLVLISLFLVIFLIYPSIVNGNTMKSLDDLMKIFPKEILAAFNMDISSISSAFGWYKTEGFVFILLITACYSGILGSNILLKEENDKTIEYLNSLPVSREKIVITKMISGLIYIILLILGIGLFNYIGLTISGDIDNKLFFLLSIIPLFPSLVVYFLCFALSTFAKKTRKMLGPTFAIVFISYILYMFSSIAEEVEFLKYFSIFTLADSRNVIQYIKIEPITVAITILLSVMLIVISVIRYHKKELI